MANKQYKKRKKVSYKPHLNVKRNRVVTSKQKGDDEHLRLPSKPQKTPHSNLEMIKENVDGDSPNENEKQKTTKRCSMEVKVLSPTYRAESNAQTVVSPEQMVDRNHQSSGNRLIDLQSFVDLIESNTLCRFCRSRVKVNEETVGIATSLRLSCSKCIMNEKTECKRTKLNRMKNNKKWDTVESFATNVFYVLGIQKIGGGAAECQVITTYLELPHPSSFGKKSFGRIESKLGLHIKKVC